MPLDAFLQQLRHNPEQLEFDTTMAVIEALYDFTPVAFQNGALVNAPGQNSGSCKLFAFAQLQKLTVEETLACFGRYYREDVLQHPDAGSHQNIRNFMESHWAGIDFAGCALTPKTR
ncbi:MAG: HopJ type III effector protein [Gammaproteobacteria bacterium]|nr:HopJ type III effector protein [Gammaproteobacteria bacterium]